LRRSLRTCVLPVLLAVIAALAGPMPRMFGPGTGHRARGFRLSLSGALQGRDHPARRFTHGVHGCRAHRARERTIGAAAPRHCHRLVAAAERLSAANLSTFTSRRESPSSHRPCFDLAAAWWRLRRRCWLRSRATNGAGLGRASRALRADVCHARVGHRDVAGGRASSPHSRHHPADHGRQGRGAARRLPAGPPFDGVGDRHSPRRGAASQIGGEGRDGPKDSGSPERAELPLLTPSGEDRFLALPAHSQGRS
jgi:hypothetical protein